MVNVDKRVVLQSFLLVNTLNAPQIHVCTFLLPHPVLSPHSLVLEPVLRLDLT